MGRYYLLCNRSEKPRCRTMVWHMALLLASPLSVCHCFSWVPTPDLNRLLSLPFLHAAYSKTTFPTTPRADRASHGLSPTLPLCLWLPKPTFREEQRYCLLFKRQLFFFFTCGFRCLRRDPPSRRTSYSGYFSRHLSARA